MTLNGPWGHTYYYVEYVSSKCYDSDKYLIRIHCKQRDKSKKEWILNKKLTLCDI